MGTEFSVRNSMKIIQELLHNLLLLESKTSVTSLISQTWTLHLYSKALDSPIAYLGNFLIHHRMIQALLDESSLVSLIPAFSSLKQYISITQAEQLLQFREFSYMLSNWLSKCDLKATRHTSNLGFSRRHNRPMVSESHRIGSCSSYLNKIHR